MSRDPTLYVFDGSSLGLTFTKLTLQPSCKLFEVDVEVSFSFPVMASLLKVTGINFFQSLEQMSSYKRTFSMIVIFGAL